VTESHTCATYQRRRVLYIEDNAPNLKLVKLFYKKNPQIELDTSTSAEEGFALIAQHHYDLILMDINLPGINGIEATQRLRHTNPQLPIVAISANAMPAEVEYAMAHGFSAYFTKPIDGQKLLQETDRLLGL